MKEYYPLLKTFLNESKLFEKKQQEEDKIPSKEELTRIAASVPKIEDSESAISPYTGKTINVKQVKEKIEKAKYKIVTQSELYRPYIHDMSPTIYTWLIPTMATDGVRLFVNPEFAQQLSFVGTIFVLLHEIMHCIFDHMKRSQGFDKKLFNVAGDLEINPILVDTNPEDFSEKFVKDEIKGLYEKKYLNIPVEEIYRDLLKNPPQLPPEPPDLLIDPTQEPPKGPQPPPSPDDGKERKAKIQIVPGTKVRIKASGKKGIVKKVNKDGTYEIDLLKESLLMPTLFFEGYKRDEFVPILKGSKDGGQGSGNVNIEDEYEIEDAEGEEKQNGDSKEGKEGKEGEKSSGGEDKKGISTKQKVKELEGKAAASSGKSEQLSPEAMAGEQKRISRITKQYDRGQAGGFLDPKLGEQIARASGYDEDEINAGAEGRAKWEANAKDMLERAEKMMKAGTGRGESLVNRLKKLLKPSTDWKTLLKLYVGRALSPETYYRIPAKKHLHKSSEYLKRGLKTKMDAINKVVVCVDTSGSMFGGSKNNITAFDRCISEIQHIIHAKKIKKITVIYFDDGVDPGSIQVVKGNQKVFIPKEIKGGGGTNFQKPLDWIKSNYNDAVNLCIFLTDGDAGMPKKPPYANKFIWLVYDNPDFKAPFGRAIVTEFKDF